MLNFKIPYNMAKLKYSLYDINEQIVVENFYETNCKNPANKKNISDRNTRAKWKLDELDERYILNHQNYYMVCSYSFDGVENTFRSNINLNRQSVTDILDEEDGVEKSSTKVNGGGNGNTRYRGNAVGNAQNLLIRNILSNLGEESFTLKDWEQTKEFFGNRCAYCGAEESLVMEHAIPINKTWLGEHRLGNIVPSCKACNNSKHNSCHDDFLKNKPEKLKKIKAYMENKEYYPLKDKAGFEEMKRILVLAHSDVRIIADRYISIINMMEMED